MGAVNTCLLLIFGQVAILDGTGIVSAEEGALLLRVDEGENDVAEVVARFSDDVGEVDGTLVVFTTFEDTGPGGRAYSLPIFSSELGIGRPLIDHRAEYGASRFVQVINMKARGGPDLLDIMAHELAHRQLAYVATGTVSILGRQNAHWHAGLHTSGSLMGGYGYDELSPGAFLVSAKNEAFSPLDLYLLGLIDAEEVPPFFFIDELRNEDGFALPESAELQLGETVFGRRVDLRVDDIIAANGERSPGSPQMNAVFAVLTAPGESTTSTRATAKAAEVEQLRISMIDRWNELTEGRGTLCTELDECTTEQPDAGCSCKTSNRSSTSAWALLLVLGFGRWRRK